jgi:hypothetical protein
MAPLPPGSSIRQPIASSALVCAASLWTTRALIYGELKLVALPWTLWCLAGSGALFAAAIGIGYYRLVPQVLARGIAWWMVFVNLPLSFPTRRDPLGIIVMALALLALYVTAPLLHRGAARAEFEPIAYRKTFLAGAVAAAAVGVTSAFGAAWQAIMVAVGWQSSIPGEVWGPALLVVPFFAASVAVLRMRAWGVLVGVAASAASIVCALPILRHLDLTSVTFTALPGLLLGAPVALSRGPSAGGAGETTWRGESDAGGTRVRVATESAEMRGDASLMSSPENPFTSASRSAGAV